MPDRTEWQRIGRNSRRKGQNKQRTVRRFLEALFSIPPPDPLQARNMGDEEAWDHLPIRVEVKAGGQVAQDMKRYNACRIQHDSWATDSRPFVVALAPDGTRIPYFIVSGDDLVRICQIYAEEGR